MLLSNCRGNLQALANNAAITVLAARRRTGR
jgi:hypothetical protein